MRRTLRALALVVPLAACSSQAAPQPAATPTTNSPPAAVTTPAESAPAAAPTIADTSVVSTTAPVTAAPTVDVPAALAFGATLVGGGSIDLAEYAGKPVAFWFWAPT